MSATEVAAWSFWTPPLCFRMQLAIEADALAASITFLLSDDSVNINGAILPSDEGWAAA